MSYQQISANFSADQQIAGMQALEAKHVDVIISAPLVPATFFQAAQTASGMGIHVLTYNKAGAGVSYAVTNPDTQEAGNIVGVLANHLRSEGKQCAIGIIDGQPTAPPLLARNTGFTAGAKAANCTVLATQVATTTTASQGSSIANSWKTRFGSRMTGIVVINDDVALGVLPVRGGQFSPEVVSLNGEPAAVNAEIPNTAAQWIRLPDEEGPGTGATNTVICNDIVAWPRSVLAVVTLDSRAARGPSSCTDRRNLSSSVGAPETTTLTGIV